MTRALLVSMFLLVAACGTEEDPPPDVVEVCTVRILADDSIVCTCETKEVRR